MERNKTNVQGEGLCPVCTYPLAECVCCAECGHDCPLDAGEQYCPVCGPAPGEGYNDVRSRGNGMGRNCFYALMTI